MRKGKGGVGPLVGKEEVGPAVVLVGAVDVELTKAPGSATSAAAVVTEVVISGPEDVVAAVTFELAVAVLFGKKAPDELAATVLFGERGILGVVELKRLDVVKLEEVRFEEMVEAKIVVVEVTVLLPGEKIVVV